MRQLRIKTLPNYFGARNHGYMPQYTNQNVSRPNLLTRGDAWHSYKEGGYERILGTWDGAYSFLAGRCGYNYVLLLLCFVGTPAEKQRAQEHNQ